MKTLLLVTGTTLLFAASSLAQTVKLPDKVEVKTGRLASVLVDYEGDDCKWTVPADIDVFREYGTDPKKAQLRIIAYTAGTYQIKAIASKVSADGKSSKLSEFAVCTLVVGEPVLPAPPPPPVDDALVTAFKQAYAAETDGKKAQYLAFVKSVCANAGPLVDAAEDNDDLFLKLQTAIRNPTLGVPKGSFGGVIQKVLGVYLNTELGKNPPNTPFDKVKAKAVLAKLTAAMQEVK